MFDDFPTDPGVLDENVIKHELEQELLAMRSQELDDELDDESSSEISNYQFNSVDNSDDNTVVERRTAWEEMQAGLIRHDDESAHKDVTNDLTELLEVEKKVTAFCDAVVRQDGENPQLKLLQKTRIKHGESMRENTCTEQSIEAKMWMAKIVAEGESELAQRLEVNKLLASERALEETKWEQQRIRKSSEFKITNSFQSNLPTAQKNCSQLEVLDEKIAKLRVQHKQLAEKRQTVQLDLQQDMSAEEQRLMQNEEKFSSLRTEYFRINSECLLMDVEYAYARNREKKVERKRLMLETKKMEHHDKFSSLRVTARLRLRRSLVRTASTAIQSYYRTLVVRKDLLLRKRSVWVVVYWMRKHVKMIKAKRQKVMFILLRWKKLGRYLVDRIRTKISLHSRLAHKIAQRAKLWKENREFRDAARHSVNNLVRILSRGKRIVFIAKVLWKWARTARNKKRKRLRKAKDLRKRCIKRIRLGAVKTVERWVFVFLARKKDRELAAAIQIQSYYRGFIGRQKANVVRATKLLRKQELAAVRIQRWFRDFAARRERELVRLRQDLENRAAIVIQSYYRGFFASRIKESIQFFDDDEYNYVEVDESLDSFRDFMESLDDPIRPLTREKEDLDAELQMLMRTIPDVPPFHDSVRGGIITPVLKVNDREIKGNYVLGRDSATLSPVLSLETEELETPESTPRLSGKIFRKTKNNNFFRKHSRSPIPPSPSESRKCDDAPSAIRNPSPWTSRDADTSAKLVNNIGSKQVSPSPGLSRTSEAHKAMEDWNFKELSTAEAWIKRKKRLTKKKGKKTTAAQRFNAFERKIRRYG